MLPIPRVPRSCWSSSRGEQQGRRGGRCREQKEGASSSQSSEPWQHPAARAGVVKLFLTREHRREIHLIHQKKGKKSHFKLLVPGRIQPSSRDRRCWERQLECSDLREPSLLSPCKKHLHQTRKSHLSSFPSLSEWFCQPQQEQFFLIPCSCCDNTRKYPWNEPLAFVQEWPLTSAGVINRACGALWGNHKAA